MMTMTIMMIMPTNEEHDENNEHDDNNEHDKKNENKEYEHK